MLTLIKNIECFSPAYLGARDLLIAADKIAGVIAPGGFPEAPFMDAVIDGTGLYAFPGFVDQHLHITGGGGEQGFISGLGALGVDAILSSGITTAVGLLGADGTTRCMEGLYAKAKALEAQGVTTYIYSGSYALPPVTLTGSLRRDMVFIDKVIGAGEIAVSDHRSVNPDARALIAVAAEAHLGGMLAGKAGVVHLHIGDGKAGLRPVMEALEASDLPADVFVPTHINRNPALFRQGADYCRRGGNIDLTAGESEGVAVPAAVKELKTLLPDLTRVTVSSDAGGAHPSSGKAAAPASLFHDFMEIIKQSILPPAQAAALFTENAAKRLKLYPRKGAIVRGGDADILITDRDWTLRMVIAGGRLLLDKRSGTKET